MDGVSFCITIRSYMSHFHNEGISAPNGKIEEYIRPFHLLKLEDFRRQPRYFLKILIRFARVGRLSEIVSLLLKDIDKICSS